MASVPVRAGHVVQGRYRLDRLLSARATPDTAGTTATASTWLGRDLTLGRAVALHVYPSGDPRARDVLGAVRAAAGVADRRLVRAVDNRSADGFEVIVTPWIEASSLAELLSAGPLPSADAVHLVREAASALASAHAAGLAHGHLRPSSLLRDEAGEAYLLGLGMDPVSERDPVAGRESDIVGCGSLLYAALTGRWPYGPCPGVSPTTLIDGHPATPRQLRAGVPAALDDVVCRALGLSSRRSRAPFASCTELVQALDALPRLPPDDPSAAPETWPVPESAPPATGSRRLTLAWVGVALAVVIAVLLGVLTVIQLNRSTGGPTSTPTTPAVATTGAPPGPTNGSTVSGGVIPIVSGSDFDPPPGTGSENPGTVHLAFDGNPGTAWRTLTYYGSPSFGGLKPGVGIVVDLGAPRAIAAVRLDLVGRGTSLQLRASDTKGTQTSQYALVASAIGAGTTVTLRPAQPLTAEYLLVWLTRLPALPGVAPPQYQGGIAEITVFGAGPTRSAGTPSATAGTG